MIANLVSSYYTGDLAAAVKRAVGELEGMYACALIGTESTPETAKRSSRCARARRSSSVSAQGESFLASDPAALIAHTRDVIFLDNGDIARLTRSQIEIWDRSGAAVKRPVTRLNWDPQQVEKGGYKHFMLKEIFEQPEAARDTFGGRVDFETGKVGFDALELAPDYVRSLSRIQLLACGTSWHAALIGKFLIEELARIPVEVDYASEYRYRDPIADASVLVAGISQSGETIDTVWAMEAAKERGARLIALSNVPGSQATRISSGTLYTHAGPEIGVASTKAFTTQLVAFYLLALYLRQQLGREVEPELLAPLAHLPQAISEALALEPRDRGAVAPLPHGDRLPLPRPRHPVPGGARGRAQAEGDLLHPRRGLPRRRDEARADRAHRREPAGGRDRDRQARLREDEEQPAGGRRRATARSSSSPTATPPSSTASPTTSCASRPSPKRSPPSSPSSRSSSSPTRSASAAAPTSTSRATSRRASPSSRRNRPHPGARRGKGSSGVLSSQAGLRDRWSRRVYRAALHLPKGQVE